MPAVTCSEIYYDRGEKYGCGKPGCTVGCDCDRYMEVWNNVFTQFENDGNGNYTTLKQKNIDTGMALSVWQLLYRMWILSLMWILSVHFVIWYARSQARNTRKTIRMMFPSV